MHPSRRDAVRREGHRHQRRRRLELSRRAGTRVYACQLHKSRRDDIRFREEGGREGGRAYPTICRTTPRPLRAYRTHVLLRLAAAAL